MGWPPPHLALMSFVKWFEREVSSPCDFAGDCGSDDRATVEAKPEDVGDQALIRGFKPQFRDFVRGCPLSTRGRRSFDQPQSDIGNSPAVASPPPLHDICPDRSPGAGSLSGLSMCSRQRCGRADGATDGPDEARQ